MLRATRKQRSNQRQKKERARKSDVKVNKRRKNKQERKENKRTHTPPPSRLMIGVLKLHPSVRRDLGSPRPSLCKHNRPQRHITRIGAVGGDECRKKEKPSGQLHAEARSVPEILACFGCVSGRRFRIVLTVFLGLGPTKVDHPSWSLFTAS